MEQWLMGRELLKEELEQPISVIQKEKVQRRTGFTQIGKNTRCNRCGATLEQDRIAAPCTCGRNCFYCVRCLQMGKIKSCSVVYHQAEENHFLPLVEPVLTWQGTLSEQQQKASADLVTTVQNHEERLVWAVAGAGKTEMLFQAIEWALKERMRICLASPRVDVCLELAPRLQTAFKEVEIAVLYGSAEAKYAYTQLVIATTHQLLRFREAFDVIIIDEIDAFPFHIDKTLQFAAQKARKKESAMIYLSATPSKEMRQQVRSKRLAASILPARYHGFPLPAPKFLWTGDWKTAVRTQKYRNAFFIQVKRLLAQQRRFLIFVPHIELMHELASCLQMIFPEAVFTSVHAEDPHRKEKVLCMRKEELDFLLTTTILERGVTFKNIDVLVLGAEDRTFTEAALVQIAGRAGRHKDFPNGEVLFFHHGQSKEMKAARKQILQMNRWALERKLIQS